MPSAVTPSVADRVAVLVVVCAGDDPAVSPKLQRRLRHVRRDSPWRVPMFGHGAHAGADQNALHRAAEGAVALLQAHGGHRALTGVAPRPEGAILVTAEATADENLVESARAVVFLWPASQGTFRYALSHPSYSRLPESARSRIVDSNDAEVPDADVLRLCAAANVLGTSDRVDVAAVIADACHKAGWLGKYGS